MHLREETRPDLPARVVRIARRRREGDRYRKTRPRGREESPEISRPSARMARPPPGIGRRSANCRDERLLKRGGSTAPGGMNSVGASGLDLSCTAHALLDELPRVLAPQRAVGRRGSPHPGYPALARIKPRMKRWPREPVFARSASPEAQTIAPVKGTGKIGRSGSAGRWGPARERRPPIGNSLIEGDSR